MGYKHIKHLGKVSLYLPITHLYVDMPTDGWWKYICKGFQALHKKKKKKKSLISWDIEAIKYLATTFKTLQARSY